MFYVIIVIALILYIIFIVTCWKLYNKIFKALSALSDVDAYMLDTINVMQKTIDIILNTQNKESEIIDDMIKNYTLLTKILAEHIEKSNLESDNIKNKKNKLN